MQGQISLLETVYEAGFILGHWFWFILVTTKLEDPDTYLQQTIPHWVSV